MNFQKFQLKWTFLKLFTRPKQWAALWKLFNTPADKILLHLWNKNVLTEIYRNIQTYAFQVLRECGSWASRNGAVQVFLSDTNQKHVGWKMCKVSKVFGCFGAVYLYVEWVEIRKTSKVFCKFLLTLKLPTRKFTKFLNFYQNFFELYETFKKIFWQNISRWLPLSKILGNNCNTFHFTKDSKMYIFHFCKAKLFTRYSLLVIFYPLLVTFYSLLVIFYSLM